MIGSQERNKVWNIMIIPWSVAVNLPLDMSKCDVTANKVGWQPCCNKYKHGKQSSEMEIWQSRLDQWQ